LQLFDWDLLSSVVFGVGVRQAPQLSGGFEYPRGVSFRGVAVWKISHSSGLGILRPPVVVIVVPRKSKQTTLHPSKHVTFL